jgi:hypothetical protein
MSEYERPDRLAREPTMEDLHELMGPSTPHFSLQIRNRIRTLIDVLPQGHPVRLEGEREIKRLERIAFEGEHRGHQRAEGERPLPSIEVPESA